MSRAVEGSNLSITLIIALSAKRFAISYAKALGGADLPLLRPHERRWSQDVRIQPRFLRGVPQSQNMCRYANATGDAHHRAQQRSKRHASHVRFSYSSNFLCLPACVSLRQMYKNSLSILNFLIKEFFFFFLIFIKVYLCEIKNLKI